MKQERNVRMLNYSFSQREREMSSLKQNECDLYELLIVSSLIQGNSWKKSNFNFDWKFIRIFFSFAFMYRHTRSNQRPIKLSFKLILGTSKIQILPFNWTWTLCNFWQVYTLEWTQLKWNFRWKYFNVKWEEKNFW